MLKAFGYSDVHKDDPDASMVANSGQNVNYGAIAKKQDDLDDLFPERHGPDQQRPPLQHDDSLPSPTFYAEEATDMRADTTSMVSEVSDTAELIKKGQYITYNYYPNKHIET